MGQPIIIHQKISPTSKANSNKHKKPIPTVFDRNMGTFVSGHPRERNSASVAASTWRLARKRAK